MFELSGDFLRGIWDYGCHWLTQLNLEYGPYNGCK